MARPKKKRPVSVAISYSEYDQRWHGYLSVGRNHPAHRSAPACASCRESPDLRERRKQQAASGSGCIGDGTPERPRCYEECADKIRTLEDQLVAGHTIKAERSKPTVRTWLTSWLTDIAPHQPGGGSRRKPLAPRTIDDYWSRCYNWVFPRLGGTRLDDLDADDLDALYAAMYEADLSEAHVLKTHAVIRRGLALALRRGKVRRNVAALMDNPGSPSRRPKKALSKEQAKLILKIIDGRDDALRWQVGLAVGPRQGEVLAIRWSCIDFDEASVDTSWQLQRRPWRHGCGTRTACGRKRAAECPDRRIEVRKGETRVSGGLVLCRRKGYTDDMQHLVVLPPELVAGLREHRRRQAAARLHAGDLWEEYDLVFTQPNGRPIDPRSDYGQWLEILAEAGLVDVGTHAMRHTAASLALEFGVELEAVQEMLGHSDPRTTRGYQQVSVGLQRRAAKKIGKGLFGTKTTDLATERRRRRPKDEAG